MCTKNQLHIITQKIADEAKDRLGAKLEAVVLYGSYARGDYTRFLTRPISLIFILIAVYSVVGPIITKAIKNRRAAKKGSAQ